jgi:hypothetical protein
MKVIDLLNKIANGEEVPKKILIRGYEFHLSNNYQEMNINYAYEDAFDNYWLDCIGINEEIEIIEEDKEIEHYDMFDYFTGYKFGGTDKDLLDHLQRNFVNINQELDYLIKAVNELKKGK